MQIDAAPPLLTLNAMAWRALPAYSDRIVQDLHLIPFYLRVFIAQHWRLFVSDIISKSAFFYNLHR